MRVDAGRLECAAETFAAKHAFVEFGGEFLGGVVRDGPTGCDNRAHTHLDQFAGNACGQAIELDGRRAGRGLGSGLTDVATVEEHQFRHLLHLAYFDGSEKHAVVEHHAAARLAARSRWRFVVAVAGEMHYPVGLLVQPGEDLERRRFCRGLVDRESPAQQVVHRTGFGRRADQLPERRADQRIADDIGSRAGSCADLAPVARRSVAAAQGPCRDTAPCRRHSSVPKGRRQFRRRRPAPDCRPARART